MGLEELCWIYFAKQLGSCKSTRPGFEIRILIAAKVIKTKVGQLVSRYSVTTGAAHEFCHPSHTPLRSQHSSLKVWEPFVFTRAKDESEMRYVLMLSKRHFLPGWDEIICTSTLLLLPGGLTCVFVRADFNLWGGMVLSVWLILHRATDLAWSGLTVWASINTTLWRDREPADTPGHLIHPLYMYHWETKPLGGSRRLLLHSVISAHMWAQAIPTLPSPPSNELTENWEECLDHSMHSEKCSMVLKRSMDWLRKDRWEKLCPWRKSHPRHWSKDKCA